MISEHGERRVQERIYDLPEIEHSEVVDSNFFEYCEGIQDFLVICIVNREGEILFIRDFDKNIGWELPGGHIFTNEGIVGAVDRVVEKEVGAAIDEVTPVAHVKNKFICDGDSITHNGLALAAMTRAPRSDLTPKDNIQKCFSGDTPQKIAYQDECVLEISKPHLMEKIAELPENEIESGRENRLRHILHKRLISSSVKRFSSDKLKNKILRKVEETPRTILDASCGDDGFIFTMDSQFKPELCIANDISWETLSILQEDNTDTDIIFTNHNLHKLPFDFVFDLVLFKNTLHHISEKNQRSVIRALNRISKHLIIMDVENPREYNFKSKAWNWYYRNVLGDEGRDFLSKKEFQTRIRKTVDDKHVEFDEVETVKGNYLLCSARTQAPTNTIT